MAGIANQDVTGGIVHAMWTEAGIQFRSNLMETVGQRVALHQHSYDHVMLVTCGRVSVREIFPDGSVADFEMPGPRGSRVMMPAYHRHEIACLEGPAEVLCFWPANDATDGGC